MTTSSSPELPEHLAALVWRTDELVRQAVVVPTGHPALDAELPGGGWPTDGMVELLQAASHRHLWQLLLPAIRQVLSARPGPLVLVGPPYEPFGPALRAQGVDPERLLWLRSTAPRAQMWSAEQALRCADVQAVVAWLPRATQAELRRLHLAAQQQARLLFVVRGPGVRHDATPARLRLWVDGVDEIRLQVLKRRGPPMATPLVLEAWPDRVRSVMLARQGKPRTAPVPLHDRRSHVLDRTVAHT